MKIVSDFKDYYDCMTKYDDDRITLFIRNKDENPDQISTNGLHMSSISQELKFCVIGFAGKLYPFMIWDLRQREIKPVYCFDKTAAMKSVKQPQNRQMISNFFDRFSSDKLAEELTEKYGPQFVVFFDNWNLGLGYPEHGNAWIVKNYPLQDFSFYKVMPPQIAYNEIYKYLCNRANPGKPIPVPDDIMKIQIAGFDPKTSFRKENRSKVRSE